jgi:PAS domain S-box-containing protein
VLEKQLKEALLEGNSRESEVKDSTGTYYLRSVQPYYNSSNKIDGAIVTFLNIHSLKITEKDLIESERLLRSIVDGISAFLIRLSADFRYLFVNKPVADMLNLSVDEIIGKYPENLKVDIEAINRVKHLWQRAIDEKQELSYENTMETNRGTLHVITKVIPEITDEGKVDSILLITTDITELKEAHHNLNQQEQEDVKISGQANLEAIIEASDDYIWSVDTNYQLMVINPAYRQFLSNHFKADPELGPSMLLNQFPEKTVKFWQSNYDKCLAGERIVRVTDEPNGKGTEKRQYKLFPIVSEQGEIVGVSCISHRLP